MAQNNIGLSKFGFGVSGSNAGANAGSVHLSDVFRSNKNLFAGQHSIFASANNPATPNLSKNYTVANSLNHSFVKIPKENSTQFFA